MGLLQAFKTQDVSKHAPIVRQVVGVGSLGMLLMMCMATIAYPAIALPQMASNTSTIAFTTQQASWFATLPMLSYIPGGVVGGAACEALGPRRVVLLLYPFVAVGMAAMAAADTAMVMRSSLAEVLLLSLRVVQGLASSLLIPIINAYSFEVAERRVRGVVFGLLEVWATTGYTLVYLLGVFFTWRTVAWAVPLVLFFPSYWGILLTPESPLWLVRNGEEDRAKEALVALRTSPEEANEDLKAALNKESEVSCWVSLRQAGTRANSMALFGSAFMLVLKEVSANTVIVMYVVEIFQLAGVGLDANWSSVMVGAVRLVFNCVGTSLIYRLPRRPMLAAGSVVAAVATATLGAFFFLQSSGYDVSHLGWLPLLCLVVYMAGYAGAEGPLCWVISVEVLPGCVRSLGCGISATVYALVAFLCSKMFSDLQPLVGLHGVFWLYSGLNLASLLVALRVNPETRGKTMTEVEAYWHNKYTRDIKI